MLQIFLISHPFSCQVPQYTRRATETVASLASYKALFQGKQPLVTN